MPIRRHEIDAESDRRRAVTEAWEKLRASLSDKQRQELDRTGCFTVVSNLGHEFTIGSGSHSGNITAITGSYSWPATYCCHLSGNVPLGEHLLAQALLIRTDEQAFRRIACTY